MDNVLINIDFAVTGQDELINGLVKIGKLTADEAAVFKQAAQVKQQAVSQQITDTNKLVDANAKTTKSIAELSNANKQLTASIPTQALKDVTKEVANHGNEMLKTTEKSKSLKAQLRAMKEELNLLEEAGKEGTQGFMTLSIEAAKLEDQLGDTQNRIKQMASDTKYLDASLQVLGGVAAAYSVAQGASALFGTDQKELQKTLVRLNAVMAIANGLQQLQNITQKENIAVTIIASGQKKTMTLITALETAAESKNIVVKTLAIETQLALNAVMNANPVMILVGGIAALTAALYYFTSGTKSATEMQTELNEAQLKNLEISKLQDEITRAATDERVKQIQYELDAKKAQGASDQELHAIEMRLNQEKQQAAVALFSKYSKDISEITLMRERAVSLEKQLNKAQTENMGEELIKQLESEKAYNSKRLETAESVLANLQDANNEYYLNKIAFDAEQRRKELTSEKAFADAKVLVQKLNSKKELDAKIADLQVASKVELSDVNLTAGQKYLIQVKLNKDIENLNREYLIKQLEDAKTFILAEQGERRKDADYQLQIAKNLAKAERDIQFAQKGVTDNQRFLYEVQYQNKIADLQKLYDENKAKSELNAKQSEIQAKLYLGMQFSDESLKLNKELIDTKEQMDINSATSTIHNEEELSAKLIEIKAKANADRTKLDNDYYTRQKQAQLSAFEHEVNMENIALSQKKGNDVQVMENELSVIGAKQMANRQYYEKGIIDHQTYLDTKYQLDEDQAKKLGELHAYEADQQKQIQQGALNFFSSMVSELFALSKQNTDNQLAELTRQRDIELSNKELTEAQKERIQKEYDDKARKIKQEAFKQEKAAKIIQATMNTANAVVSALEAGPLIGPVLAAMAGALGAAQIAIIASQPIPQFAKGTKGNQVTPAGFKWVGEEGPELIHTPGGEKIVTHSDSMQLLKMYGLSATPPPLPSGNSYVPIGVNGIGQNVVVNDNGAVVSALGNIETKLENLKQVNITMDKSGFRSHLVKRNSTVEVLNDKFRG